MPKLISLNKCTKKPKFGLDTVMSSSKRYKLHGVDFFNYVIRLGNITAVVTGNRFTESAASNKIINIGKNKF